MNIQRLVHEQWPAREVHESHGWLLRYADGVTKRANSVFPAAEPDDLDAAIAAAEAFYRSRGRPAIFSLDAAAPAGLDAELAARGYAVVDPTLAMTRPLDGTWDPPAYPVTLSVAPSDGWMACWWAVDGRGGDAELGTARAILTGAPSTYASIGDGLPDAVGRVTVSDGWAGIYCMAVRADRRGQGLGRSVLTALLDAGRAAGASTAYLVVVEQNAVARSLYAGLGFTVAGGYHYRHNNEQ